MNDQASKETVSTEIGAVTVDMKAKGLRESIQIAASVALLDIEEKEKAALDKIRQEAGEKRGKIKRQTQEILSSSDMKVVRRFWNTKHEDMFMHFLGDRTSVRGFGSAKEPNTNN